MGSKPNRPYDEAVAQEVCKRIASGEHLRAICNTKGIPGKDTLYGWMAKTPPFADAFARAREAQMNGWADEIIDIADDASTDYAERTGKGGEVERAPDPEVVARAKLRIDTRKFVMSKLAAATFGDKVSVNLTGALAIEALSDGELERRLRAGLERLGLPAPDGPLLLGPALPPTEPDE